MKVEKSVFTCIDLPSRRAPPLDVAFPCNIPALHVVTIEWLDPNFTFSAADLAYSEMVLARAAAMGTIHNLA